MAKLTPYPFQVRDQDILRAGNWTGLVAIEAGGGKSLTATLAIGEAKPRVTLIIAPKSTHHTAWIPTLRDNLGVEARIIGNDNKATKTALADYLLGYEGVFISSPQFVTRSDVTAWCGDMLIVDEVHMAGANTPKSKLQRKLSGYTPTEARTALNTRFSMRLALSATPMRSDFANIWGVTRLLWPELCYRGEVAYDNFAGFQADRQEWIEVVTGYTWENTGISLATPYHAVQARFGSADDLRLKKGDEGTWLKGKPKKARKYLHEKTPGQLMSELPTLVMHKRRERCCDDPSHANGFLPVDEPQIIERTVELTAKQRKAIQQMNDLMMTYLASSPLIAEIPLTAKMRIRQLTLGEADATSVMVQTEDGPVERTTLIFPPDCVSPVIDETIHILSNLPEGEPVIVHHESQRFAEVMVHRLNEAGFSAEEYSGVRKADLTQFGKKFQVLVGVISALGTGTAGLNAVCSTEIFAEQPLSLTARTQVTARLERMDNTRQVQRFVILDDEGVQLGRMEELWQQQLLINSSMRVA